MVKLYVSFIASTYKLILEKNESSHRERHVGL